MLSQRTGGKELPRGLDAAWDAATGLLRRLLPLRERFLRRAERIVSLEKRYSDLSEARLRCLAEEFRHLFRRGRQAPADLDHAFALIREVAWRQLGERPFLVQVAGALAIEAGCVAEMATGEGKTLTATLPAVIAGWCGRGCHIITVNDYLARRDAEWMRGIYAACGLTAAHVEGGMSTPQRRAAYAADITYCTNKEVTADFLRDRIELERAGVRGLSSALLARIVEGSASATDRLVQRGLHRAIIDEADSILIDEAVTPVIISGQAPNPEAVEAFQQAASLAELLRSGDDYKVSQRFREVDLTEEGKRRLAELAEPLGGIWTGARRREEMLTQALTARELYLRDKQYVIQEGKVVIVDEFTGRLMPDREWRDGLHQAVAAKEAVEVQSPKETFSRVSFQRFFRLYQRLSGMTGTAREGWREFWQIYHAQVVVIPTNRPCARTVLTDMVLADEEAKWAAIVEQIEEIHRTGRPILVGTRSVRASEHLSAMLTVRGLDYSVLNAVRHAEEAQIVAGAGQAGRITVATNMAGRGTDIKLGRGVAQLGGLYVLATERHESGRVDRQLFGRSARQGDPGTARAIVSLEDELVRRYAPALAASFRRRHAHARGDIVSRMVHGVFQLAQHRAERLALRQRKAVLRTDDWLDQYLGFAGAER
jgi:preprotein translocase subunit SecA